MTTCTVGTQTDEIVMCTTSTQTDEDVSFDVVLVTRRQKIVSSFWDDEFLYFPKVPLPTQKKRKIYS